LRHADIAMLNAKRRGGAQYQLFNPRMSERVAKQGVVEFLTG
jgi:hypothetical protein